MNSSHTFVLIDTDVWSNLYIRPKSASSKEDLEQKLRGRSLVIATQTRAELLCIPGHAKWGDRRRGEFLTHLDAFPTIPVTEPLVQAFAELKVECKRLGHPLHEKIHTADSWIAATARAHELPLMSLDKVFRDAPQVELFT